MMTTPFNEVAGDGTCQTIDKIVNNFISQHHDKSLSPLRLANISISEFSTALSNYLSVLNEGGSIAFGRGEDLTSKSLSKSLESLFSITTPSVREGPPLTWTRLVLFAGPQFEGPAQLKVGNSSVELSENNLKLLRSGRPWRFLFPWPDKDDYKKELQSNDTVLQELVDARQTIGEVLEQISLVTRRLRNHRDLISRLSENTQYANHRGVLPFDGAQSSVPNKGFSSPVAQAEHKSSSYRDSPSTPTTVQYPSNDQTDQLLVEEPNDPALPEGTIARNNLQRDGSLPKESARPGFRLHASDFIQSLSEILDDPMNRDAIRWSENGQTVYVALESKFPPHILKKLSTKSHQSLVRRLYYFGFHKTGGAFHHECFSRGQPSSIGPNQEMSHSPSRPSSLGNSASQRRPRYKVIKRKRVRESV
ncbi:hypothetical protein N7449_005000 [Penicillium cf. viridicatum]|uniref:HSF-type DNA-binding domain-containing protein n=1 Tax=Penicillium cf. viridicatum TaxID=2972119 RepID=A0A9W9MKA5_9EURO|nr:hypothetical protein N7449_005000 [Penicillium cf. viridicatum]